MNKNYYQQFLNTVQSVCGDGKKPKLLLHVCCAPCSTHCLSVLVPHFDVTVFYYNPNISPFEEYQRRLNEEKRFLLEAYGNKISVVEEQYDGEVFERMAKGLEELAEGGERCKKCYALRLSKTAQYAKQHGFDFFTTTLTVSPYKHSATLNQIGEEIARQFGVNYLFSDFKKQNGYLHSIELSKKYNLYRQDYCGCKFSKQQREMFEAQRAKLAQEQPKEKQ